MLRAMAWMAFLSTVASCSGGLTSQQDFDGRTRSYTEGLPDHDLEAYPQPNNPGDSLRVHLGLVPASLVYRPTADRGYKAAFRYLIRVNGQLVVEREDSLFTREIESTQTYARQVVTVDLSRSGVGREEVESIVEDLATERRTERRQVVEPEDGAGARVYPPVLRVDGRPLVSLEVERPGAGLEARGSVQVLGGGGCAVWRLMVVPTDSSIATPPFSLTPNLGSRVYRGALYADADSMRAEPISLVPGWHEVSWAIPRHLDPGVHRVELSWSDRCEAAAAGPPAAGRSFIVRPAGFPRVTHLDQMIDALEYVATRSEMEELRTSGDAIRRKEAFDAFWGRTIGDPLLAGRAIGRYYGRVEEANRQFSGYKEGWKTDRGMIYVVLGPPLYTEDAVDELRWFYSYDARTPGRYFVFERVRGHDDDLDLPHYILRRSMEQEREWQLAVRRWRRGDAR